MSLEVKLPSFQEEAEELLRKLKERKRLLVEVRRFVIVDKKEGDLTRF